MRIIILHEICKMTPFNDFLTRDTLFLQRLFSYAPSPHRRSSSFVLLMLVWRDRIRHQMIVIHETRIKFIIQRLLRLRARVSHPRNESPLLFERPGAALLLRPAAIHIMIQHHPPWVL